MGQCKFCGCQVDSGQYYAESDTYACEKPDCGKKAVISQKTAVNNFRELLSNSNKKET